MECWVKIGERPDEQRKHQWQPQAQVIWSQPDAFSTGTLHCGQRLKRFGSMHGFSEECHDVQCGQ